MSNHLRVIECLLNHNADINAKNDVDSTPLHLAIEDGNLSVVEFLLNHSADLNAKNENNSTPLHLATQIGNLSVVECLINKGSDINSTGYNSELSFLMTHLFILLLNIVISALLSI